MAAVRKALEGDNPYDLICLDIMMPEMNGQEALVIIRELEKEFDPEGLHTSRVIMTTALEDWENIRQAYEASADGYIVKPIEKKKFLAKLQELGLEIALPA